MQKQIIYGMLILTLISLAIAGYVTMQNMELSAENQRLEFYSHDGYLEFCMQNYEELQSQKNLLINHCRRGNLWACQYETNLN